MEFSFELFPPRAEETLWRAIDVLAPLGPRFISVTCGAGGADRARTQDIALRLRRQTGIPVAAHLTCAGASRAEIRGIAERYWEGDIRHIVALRGDPPPGETYAPRPDGYGHTFELVAALKEIAPFEVSVAGHPEARDGGREMESLRRKADAGADRIISQFFFEPEVFLDFRDRVAASGIRAPVVPGVLPIFEPEKTFAFASRCCVPVPERVKALFAAGSLLQQEAAARDLAVEWCRKLYAGGVGGVHFYTLNRAGFVASIIHSLEMVI